MIDAGLISKPPSHGCELARLCRSFAMKVLLILPLLLLMPCSAFQMAPLTHSVAATVKRRQSCDTTGHSRRFASTRTLRGRLQPLSMSSDGEESPSDDDNDKMAKKVKGRKKRVVIGNGVVVLGYLLWTLVSVVSSLKNTDKHILQTLISLDPGPLLASGFAYILISASQNDRLSSDTYKRLNLMLGTYGLVGVVTGSSRGPLWLVPSVVAMINSVKGYGYGLKGWQLRDKVSPVKDIMEGCKANLKCLTKISNERSVGYLLATLFVGAITVIMRRCSVHTKAGDYATLALLATTTLTLKDAADRGRLEGTTFIELNFMGSAAFAQTSGKRAIVGSFCQFLWCLKLIHLCPYATNSIPLQLSVPTFGNSNSSLFSLFSTCRSIVYLQEEAKE